jgi:mono/diheme cytochrome c family protein
MSRLHRSGQHDTQPKRIRCLQLMGAAAVFALAGSLLAQNASDRGAPITAVEGESWIRHLHRPFAETSMGKTWELGPAPAEPGDEADPWQLKLSPSSASQALTLSGSDLYRLNCRGCHGESGQGAPPEINSITGPVQSTSVAATMERMKKAGREMSRSDVAAMAKESKIILLQRLHNGGKNMPAPTLSGAEIRSLVAYLDQLSGVAGAEKNQISIKESPYRVGEHIVKSTCHVCHSAHGPNPDPQEIMEGAIPPLSCLTTRVGLPDFVRKVTSGAPIIMGTPATPYRGRMPVFPYLSQDEAADAYMYLALYPPQK